MRNLTNSCLNEQLPDFFYLTHNKSRLDDKEQSEIMTFLMQATPHKNSIYTWDDIGVANLMSDAYDKAIRFCPQNGAWYVWDRQWQKQGEDGIIMDKLQTLTSLLLLYCKEQAFVSDDDTDKDIIDKYDKFISSIRRYNPMRNIIKTMSTMLRMNLKDMDTNPYVLNTTNHAYDLRTGKKVDDLEQYNVTKKALTRLPDFATKPCTRWYDFIDEIMEGDESKKSFLQRALGYSLLGVNREECMFIAYGSKTRNGKGTLFSSIEKALGEDYISAAPVSLICESKSGKTVDLNSPQPVLAKLVGTRIVTMSESPRDVRLDSANMKTMTGRDTMITRGLYESSFSFVPQFTLWLNTNHLPSVTDDTVFSSNRIWVIEFNRHFDEVSQDKNLKEIFAGPENLPTILKWLYDGCADYIKRGALDVPDCVKRATANYKKLHDRIGSFLEDCCATDENKKCLRGELYTAYRQWCIKSENKFQPLGSTTFYNEITVRGFPIRKISDWYVQGLVLKSRPTTLI